MNANFDVVVVGAGPIGITCATALKALAPQVKICVIDDRPEPKRNHGLKIRQDSVNKIHEILTGNSEQVTTLKGIFSKWSESFIRTSKIELDMAETARQFGVVVLRGEANKFSKDLINEGVLGGAKLIIGADGAHSAMRDAIGSKKVDVKTLQYLVELKYQSEGTAIPRSYSEAFYESAICGHMDIESMHKGASADNKPVTLHIFVEQSIYEALRQRDDEGRMKGVFGNSWTLDEVKELSKENPEIFNIYSTFKRHLDGIANRGGSCEDAKISTLEMTIYRSDKGIAKMDNKFVMLAGDAYSGMVIERGFNKGLKEAALCASAAAEFFLNNSQDEGMPKPFITYEESVKQIFEEEKKWAELKNIGINLAESSFASSRVSIETSNRAFSSSWNLLSLITNLFPSSQKSEQKDI